MGEAGGEMRGEALRGDSGDKGVRAYVGPKLGFLSLGEDGGHLFLYLEANK